MFFLVERTESVSVLPKHFSSTLKEHVVNQLKKKLEGRSIGNFGYTILVTTMIDMSSGKLRDYTGEAEFEVRYLSLIFRPFIGEVLFAQVTVVNQVRFAKFIKTVKLFELKFDLQNFKWDRTDSSQKRVQ
ncbi:DNA-directed RNA polymerase II subunit RPB7, variant 2 [Bonamia ostreae]|uniref:DNA-directed RNA polymerase II subunit RPB7, variant 2 n=1 Tax=Bonamia ostreae TaxID=126728 RepID=A0ABV2ASQ3_9EUKA